jgi:hypothetical protein
VNFQLRIMPSNMVAKIEWISVFTSGRTKKWTY